MATTPGPMFGSSGGAKGRGAHRTRIERKEEKNIHKAGDSLALKQGPDAARYNNFVTLRPHGSGEGRRRKKWIPHFDRPVLADDSGTYSRFF